MPVFSNPNLVTIVLDSLQFLQNQQRITLYSYVIMENHLHLIASAEDFWSISTTIRWCGAMWMIQLTGGIRAIGTM
jgi:REP element-mobilizing transposase RayT